MLCVQLRSRMAATSGQEPLGSIPVLAAPLSPRCHRPRRPCQQSHEHARHTLMSARVVVAAPPLLGSKRPSAAARVLCSRAPRSQMGRDAGSTHAALNPRTALTHLLRHRASPEEAQCDLCAPLRVQSMKRVSSESDTRSSSSAECASSTPDLSSPLQLTSVPPQPQQPTAPLQRRRLLPKNAPEPAVEAECASPSGMERPPSAPNSPRGRGGAVPISATMKGFTKEQDELADVESMRLEGTRAIRTQVTHPSSGKAADSRSRSLSTKGHLGSTRSPRGAPALASARSPPSAPARASTSKRAGRLGSSARASKKKDSRLALPFSYDDDDPRVAHVESVAGPELPQFWAGNAAWPSSAPPPPHPSYWG